MELKRSPIPQLPTKCKSSKNFINMTQGQFFIHPIIWTGSNPEILFWIPHLMLLPLALHQQKQYKGFQLCAISFHCTANRNTYFYMTTSFWWYIFCSDLVSSCGWHHIQPDGHFIHYVNIWICKSKFHLSRNMHYVSQKFINDKGKIFLLCCSLACKHKICTNCIGHIGKITYRNLSTRTWLQSSNYPVFQLNSCCYLN